MITVRRMIFAARWQDATQVRRPWLSSITREDVGGETRRWSLLVDLMAAMPYSSVPFPIAARARLPVPQAGWYADPSSSSWQLFRDGQVWTNNQSPADR